MVIKKEKKLTGLKNGTEKDNDIFNNDFKNKDQLFKKMVNLSSKIIDGKFSASGTGIRRINEALTYLKRSLLITGHDETTHHLIGHEMAVKLLQRYNNDLESDNGLKSLLDPFKLMDDSIIDSSDDNRSYAQVLSNLGIMKRNEEKLEEAISLFEKAYETYQNIGDSLNASKQLLELTVVNLLLMTTESINKAENYVNHVLTVISDLNFENIVAKALLLRALIDLFRDNSEKALKTIDNVIKIFEQTSDFENVATSMNILAIMCFLAKDYQKAINLLFRSLLVLESIGLEFNENIQVITKIMIEANINQIQLTINNHKWSLLITEKKGLTIRPIE